MLIHECEQSSETWHGYRAGLPTASEFSKLITSKGEPSKQMAEYAMQLAAEAYAGKPLDRWSGNQWTERGNELEQQARAWYSLVTDQDVSEVGFVTDDLVTYGCSPDGLIGENGTCEFKCLAAKNHVKVLTYYKKFKKSPTDYVAQCQGEMFVCEREWNDLVFFHPDLPSIIIRQEPIQAVFTGLEAQLKAVIAERNIILNTIKEF